MKTAPYTRTRHFFAEHRNPALFYATATYTESTKTPIAEQNARAYRGAL